MITFKGPENPPYNSASFTMEVRFPDEYPKQPPNIHFLRSLARDVPEIKASITTVLFQELKWT